MRLRTRTLSTQILGGQVIVLLVAGAIGIAFSKRAVRQLVDHQYEQRALAIAETTATMPSIRAAMADGDASRTVEGLAEQVIARTGASYVVVIDRHRMRHSHPIPALIGQPVAEPLVALDGRGHVGIDAGNLGRSANGKAPIFGSDGTVIGEVSAGLLENRVSSEAAGQLPGLAAYALVALAAGIVVAWALARRLKRQTFGLELDEIAALLQDREATLHGIREGVIALDPAGRVSLINDQAHLLLHTPPDTLGRPVSELFPDGRLLDLLVGKGSGHDQVVLFGDRLLVVNRMPITRRGKALGTVVTLRDRTELEAALRELDDVRGFTDALRAQQHEFSNRMHVIAGLLELGRYQEAESFVSEVSGATAGLAAELETRISSPLVIALLVAKTTVAIERGVNLTVTGESRLEVDQDQANALVSIIGNLVDNAIDAAAGHAGGAVRRGRWPR
jgi:two-component system, CitB family, sensor kinase